LQNIVNNIFFHVEKVGAGYPLRNFTSFILSRWREQIAIDWQQKYGDEVIGFESLIQLPRPGECYRRDGWTRLEKPTEGYSCKRTGGKGTDTWTGKRVWNTNREELKPKWVFCRKP
jgi:hypothetical protein